MRTAPVEAFLAAFEDVNDEYDEYGVVTLSSLMLMKVVGTQINRSRHILLVFLISIDFIILSFIFELYVHSHKTIRETV